MSEEVCAKATKTFRSIGSPEEGQILEDDQVLEIASLRSSTDDSLSRSNSRLMTSSTNDSPRSNAFSDSEFKVVEAESCISISDDKAKKPRLKFGGGLVSHAHAVLLSRFCMQLNLLCTV